MTPARSRERIPYRAPAAPRTPSDPPGLAADPEWAVVVAQLPADLETQARTLGALQRRREVQNAACVIRCALIYALSGWSLRMVAFWAAAQGCAQLSHVALRNRLRQVQRVLAALVTAQLIAPIPDLADRRARLRLIDASTARQPGSTGIDWRLHLGFDIGTWRCDHIAVTTGQVGETLRRIPAQPGDIVVADRAYCSAAGISAIAATGAAVVVRVNWHNLPVQTATGAPVDLLAWLKTVPPDSVCEQAVWLHTPTERIALRLVARRLTPAAAERARQRLRRVAQKQGRTPSDQARWAAGYLLVATTLAAAAWPAEQVLLLYRIRWQVEIAFKRLKGVLSFGAVPAKDAALAQTYVYATLLAALLADGFGRTLGAQAMAWFHAVARPVSLWRWVLGWTISLREAIMGPRLTPAVLAAALSHFERYVRDTRRKRVQQAAAARCLLRHHAGDPSVTTADIERATAGLLAWS